MNLYTSKAFFAILVFVQCFFVATTLDAQISEKPLINTDGLANYSIQSTQNEGNVLLSVLGKHWYLVSTLRRDGVSLCRLYPTDFFAFPNKGTGKVNDDVSKPDFCFIGNRLYVSSKDEESILVYNVGSDCSLSVAGVVKLPGYPGNLKSYTSQIRFWRINRTVYVVQVMTKTGRTPLFNVVLLGDSGDLDKKPLYHDQNKLALESLLNKFSIANEYNSEGKTAKTIPDFLCITAIAKLSYHYQLDWKKTEEAIAVLRNRSLLPKIPDSGGFNTHFWIGKWLFVKNHFNNKQNSDVLQKSGETIVDLDSPNDSVLPQDAYDAEASTNSKGLDYFPEYGTQLSSSLYVAVDRLLLRVLPNGRIGYLGEVDRTILVYSQAAWAQSIDGKQMFQGGGSISYTIDIENGSITSIGSSSDNAILLSLAKAKDAPSIVEIYRSFRDPNRYRESSFNDIKKQVVESGDIVFLKQVFTPVFGDIGGQFSRDPSNSDSLYNPIRDCIRLGNLEMLEFFLRNVPVLAKDLTNNFYFPDNLPPLCLAAQLGSFGACKLLLDAGADPSVACVFLQRGRLPIVLNPLSFATSDSIRQLLKKAGTASVAQLNESVNGYINDTNVTFRELPQLSSPVTKSFKKGEVIDVIGNGIVAGRTELNNGYWCHVRDRMGKKGWVWSTFVSFDSGEQ